jgi:hypothetical protein
MTDTIEKLASLRSRIKRGSKFTFKIILPSLLGLAIIATIILRVFFLSFVDKHEIGYSYNKVTGEINEFDRTGYFLFPPWFYSVHSIDMRPMQLQIVANSFGNASTSINTVNQRVLNAKLVRFNPEGLDKFIEWHGRDAGDSRKELAEILRCYAFNRAEGRDCPFITIERELNPAQTLEESK